MVRSLDILHVGHDIMSQEGTIVIANTGREVQSASHSCTRMIARVSEHRTCTSSRLSVRVLRAVSLLLQTFLKSVPLMSPLSDGDMNKIESVFLTVSVADGHVLCRESSRADHLYIVNRGNFHLLKAFLPAARSNARTTPAAVHADTNPAEIGAQGTTKMTNDPECVRRVLTRWELSYCTTGAVLHNFPTTRYAGGDDAVPKPMFNGDVGPVW